ncbi:hypothetical protein PoB_005245400 [Plakobranchus ocellatus]|uniref:Uncharacterized protein n=1 Tax=Plakobranchus ocellatus TaxID=259542 RepID=A0AAV4C5I5_9GAST|nr:hypothetical protein PoB_005245400 [Plakobranchus ocellatus]
MDGCSYQSEIDSYCAINTIVNCRVYNRQVRTRTRKKWVAAVIRYSAPTNPGLEFRINLGVPSYPVSTCVAECSDSNLSYMSTGA